MVVMYFFFPETTNVVVVSVLNFVALFLSFFTHYTSSRKDEDLNVLTFSCLLSSLFSLFLFSSSFPHESRKRVDVSE